jgi:pilus assembly protein FimV
LPSLELGDDADPLMRKLELAEEFRQIGDLEGARDLLEEVVASAEGALKTKAQGMLDSLG